MDHRDSARGIDTFLLGDSFFNWHPDEITVASQISHCEDSIRPRSGAWPSPLLCGMVDLVPQSTDYPKHNLIFGDLIDREWPVQYQTNGESYFLCYGLGFYLVPAVVSKIFGIGTIGFFSFLWNSLGIILFLHWLGHQFPKNPKLGIVATLLGSGLGVFWHIFKSGFIFHVFGNDDSAYSTGDQLLELGIYTSNLDSFTRLFYQPQHGIIAFLGGAVLYDLVIQRGRWPEAALILSSIFLWSPFSAIALGFVGLAALFNNPRTVRLRPLTHCLTALLILITLTAYFLPHIPIPEKGFIWSVHTDSSWWIWYLVFCSCFVWIPASAIAWIELRRPFLGNLKPVVIAMTILLSLVPLFKFGALGDMRMQISGPAFLFLSLAIAKALVESPVPRRSLAYSYLVLVFLAGALFPVARSLQNLFLNPKTDYGIAALRERELHSILDLKMQGFTPSNQYLGRLDSSTAEWILKPVSPQPAPRD